MAKNPIVQVPIRDDDAARAITALRIAARANRRTMPIRAAAFDITASRIEDAAVKARGWKPAYERKGRK
jgi:hypothetical protein